MTGSGGLGPNLTSGPTTRLLGAVSGIALLVAIFALLPVQAASRGLIVPPSGRATIQRSAVVSFQDVESARVAPGQHPVLVLPVLTFPKSVPGGSWRPGPAPPVLAVKGTLTPSDSASAQVGSSSEPVGLTRFPAATLAGDVSAFGSDQSIAPPDTQVAAGPADLVAPVNSSLWIWSKSGALLGSADLNVFFSVPTGYSFTDPRVAYNPAAGRWFLSGLSFDSFNDSQVYIAVSETGDPTGSWYVYTLSAQAAVVQDQPKLGFDSSVVVLSWADYSGTPLTFSGQETWVLNESELLSGSTVDYFYFGPDASRFDVVPAISLTSSTTAYAAYNDSCGSNTTGRCNTGSSAVGVVALTGVPPATVTWTEYDPTIFATTDPPPADQPGALASISTNDDRFLSVTYDAGTLYVSSNDSCVPLGDSSARPCARLIEVALLSSPTVTMDADFGSVGGDIYYPAAAPDPNGNVVMGATYSSSTVYPDAVGLVVTAGSSLGAGMYYVGPGGGTYQGLTESGFNGFRWGDYSGVSVDPANPADVWVAGEYSPSTGSDWGTAIGELTFSPPSVTGVNPNTGPMAGGTTVTVQGANFAAGATVAFGSTAASSVNVVSPTELQAVSPASAAGLVNLTVTTAAGTSPDTTADQFTYEPPPSVTAVSPDYGGKGGGTTVTITGSNLSGATAVDFGTVPASSFTVASSTSIAATSPPGTPGTVDVRVTTPYGTSAAISADEYTYVLSAYTPLSPTRLLDTRTNGDTLGPGGSLNLTVVGGSVPSDATAVAINVTVTDTTAPSYLSVYPAGEPQPLVSNLNWSGGETVPNLVIVPVGSGGEITFYNDQGRADVVVDLEGYFAPEPPTTATGSYVPLTPARIADTRLNSGEPYSGDTLGPGATLDIQVTGMGGVPSSGVAAVLANVTVTDTTAPSYLTVYPQGQSQPLASNLNWVAGDTVANRVVVPVSSTGQIAVFNDQGSTDVVVDVDGYFTSGTTAPSGAGLFTPINPARVLDTRLTGQTLGPSGSLTEQLAGVDGIAAQATAVVANFTVTDTTAPSYLTVYPGPTRPLASDLNWLPGQTVPNLTVATLSTTGTISAYNDQGSTDLIIDAFGYFSPP